MGKHVTTISAEALKRLQVYSFPGNVRELENVVERGVAVADGEVLDSSHLPTHLHDESFSAFRRKNGRILPLEEQERAYIRWVLDEMGGNQTAAAQTLGINRSSLWRKLKTRPSDR